MSLVISNSENGSRWRHIARALKSRNYRLFFMGQGASIIGTWMQRTALLWLVSAKASDERSAALWLGIVGFSGQISSIVLTPLAGVLADHWNRQRMIIGTQTLAMLQAFTLAILTLSGVIEIWHIIVLAFWLGAVHSVDVPVRQSFVSEMVDRPEDLNNAIALNSSIVNCGRLIGPALGGILTAWFGAGVCFLFNGFSFLAVIAALLAMRIPPRKISIARKHVFAHLADGVRYAMGFPPIRSLLLLMTLVSLVGIPYTSLLPVFAKYVLGGGARSYGMLVSGVGMGALAGAIYLAARTSVRGLEKIISFAPVMLGVGLIAFSLSRSFLLSVCLMPLMGIGQMLIMASGNTVLQTIVDDDKRGRVMSFYALSFMGMVPLGNLLAGFVASRIGPSLTVAIGGSLCIGGAIVFKRNLPTLQKFIHPIYVRKGIIPSEVVAGLQTGTEQTPPLPTDNEN